MVGKYYIVAFLGCVGLKVRMAVFILETDNPSRRIVRLLFYVSSINTGRTTTNTESASEEASKTPSTCSRVFSKTETFSSEYGYRPHVTGVFGHRKRRFSNTLSRVEIFENGDVSYSCGRAKTQVFKYDDVMPRFRACSSSHTIGKRCVWTQIFLNAEKKISVFENTRLRVDGQIRFKNATCGRRFF